MRGECSLKPEIADGCFNMKLLFNTIVLCKMSLTNRKFVNMTIYPNIILRYVAYKVEGKGSACCMCVCACDTHTHAHTISCAGINATQLTHARMYARTCMYVPRLCVL